MRPVPQSPRDNDLWVYLFGDPRNPSDSGVIGRIETEVKALRAMVRSVLRLGWAIVVTLLAVLGTLIASLVTRH
jgi:hypothetical protein